MTLKEQIMADLKQAMKDKNQTALSTLRMLSSAIKNKEIETGKELSDTDIQQVVSTQVKQRKDSINQYTEGGRPELADGEKAEIKVLEKYMPEQISEEKLTEIIQNTIKETGASTPADLGKVMGKLMPQIQGKADGSKISQIVKQQLSK